MNNKISIIKKHVLSLIISIISVVSTLSVPIFGENDLIAVNPQTGDMVIIIAIVIAIIAIALLLLLRFLKKK